MRIIGIDPGYAIVGYGIVDYEKSKFNVIDYGSITTTPKNTMPERLNLVYDALTYIFSKYKPEAIAFEELFFNQNAKTVINVGQARGVSVLAAQRLNINVFEYTPLQVKQAVVGYGRAEKKQVQEMVKTLLRLKSVPKPDDTADALAVAICHGHSSGASKLFTIK